MKLAVGVTEVAHLAALQAERLRAGGELRHRTRNFPRRADEIRDGGSMYWVIAGAMVVRQRVADIVEDQREDGSRCAAILLDHALTPVAGRRMKPFQGWRYLAATDAPADLDLAATADGVDALPSRLRAELRALGLL